MDQSTFSWEEHPANPSASPDCERDWLIRVATWPSPFSRLLMQHGPAGWYGRTSPASCHRAEDAPTLRAMGHSESHANAGGQVAVAFDIYNQAISDQAQTLCALQGSRQFHGGAGSAVDRRTDCAG